MNTLALRQDLAVLTEVSAALADAGLDLPVLLDTITDLLATHVADSALVYLLQDDGVTLELESLASHAPGLLELTHSVLSNRPRRADDPGLIGTCFASKKPVVVNDIDPAAFRAQLPESYDTLFADRPFPNAIVYVPLLAHGEALGVLVASRTPPSASFDDNDVNLVCDVGELAATTILNALLHRRLAEMTALFESVFAHAPIGMAIHSADAGASTFIRVNTALAELLGRPESDLVGESVADSVEASDRAEVDAFLARVRAGEILGHSGAIHLRRGDGTTIAARIAWRVVPFGANTSLILSQVRQQDRT